MWDTLRRLQGFVSEIFIMLSLLRGKLFFSTPLGQTKCQQFSDFLCIFMLSFSRTFRNNLNYASALNIREVIKPGL